MKTLLNTLKFIFGTLLAVAIIVSYYQSFYSPTEVGILAFSDFAFPYLWALGSVVFIVLLLLSSKVTGIIMFIALATTFRGAMSVVQLLPNVSSTEVEGTEIKLVTFNIGTFDKSGNGKNIAIQEMQELVKDADIVCLQEAPSDNLMTKVLNGKNYRELFGFKYEDTDYYCKKSLPHGNSSQIILSRYPFEIEKPIGLELDKHLMPAVFDINGKKIRIVNCHLESIRLLKEQLNAVNKIQHADIHGRHETKSELRTTYDKMKRAFHYRAIQTDTLVDIIKRSEMPIIVCGDFNDTPISYSYNKISELLDDTFEQSFMEIGHTYNGQLPKMRIDYIFHSRDLKATSYFVNKQDISDHYAVVSTIVIPD